MASPAIGASGGVVRGGGGGADYAGYTPLGTAPGGYRGGGADPTGGSGASGFAGGPDSGALPGDGGGPAVSGPVPTERVLSSSRPAAPAPKERVLNIARAGERG